MKKYGKKVLSLLLTLVMIISLLPTITVPAAALTEIGGVYQIGSAQDLKDFADLVNQVSNGVRTNRGTNAVLTANIDMSSMVASFDPIAYTVRDQETNINYIYSGTFDGQGHVIYNYDHQAGYLTNDKIYKSGLFGTVNGTIKNLVVSGDIADTDGKTLRSGFIGNAVGATLLNCGFVGTVDGYGRGGFIGTTEHNAGKTNLIYNCWSSATNPTGTLNVGFIGGGSNIGTNTIEHSYQYIDSSWTKQGTGGATGLTLAQVVNDLNDDEQYFSRDGTGTFHEWQAGMTSPINDSNIPAFSSVAYDSSNKPKYTITLTPGTGLNNPFFSTPTHTKGTELIATLTPQTNYMRPDTISVTMAGAPLTKVTNATVNGTYSYNSSSGQIVIPKVTGNIVITASGVSTTAYVSSTGHANPELGNRDKPYSTLQAALNALPVKPATGTVILLSNVNWDKEYNPNSTIPDNGCNTNNKDITITSDSGSKFTVSCTHGSHSSSMFHLPDNSQDKLTLTNVTINGAGHTGGSYGEFFIGSGSELTLGAGATLQGFNPRAINIRNGGTVTMLPGSEIKGCTAGANAAYIDGYTGTANVGAAVYICPYGTFDMQGGSITGNANSVVATGGGAVFGEGNSTFKMKGNVEVKDNTNGDVFLGFYSDTASTIKLTGELTCADGSIGVYASQMPNASTPTVNIAVGDDYTVAADDAKAFFSNRASDAGIVANTGANAVQLSYAARQITVTLAGSNMKWYSDSGYSNQISSLTDQPTRTHTVHAKADSAEYRMPESESVDEISSYTRDASDKTKASMTITIPAAAGTITLDAEPDPLKLTSASYSGNDGYIKVEGTYSGKANTDVLMEYSTDGSTWQTFLLGTDASGSFSAQIPATVSSAGTTIYLRDEAVKTIVTSDTVNYSAATPFAVSADVHSSGGGTAEVSPSGSINANSAITFTATPGEGKTFAGWYSDAACSAANKVSSSAVFSTVMPAAPYSLWAKFVEGYQPTQLINGGFELPELPDDFIGWKGYKTIPGWSTTDTSGFELVRAPKGGPAAPHHGLAAFEGEQYAEMTYFALGTLYQDLATTPKDIIAWSLQHGGHTNLVAQTMTVHIGAPTGPPTTTSPSIGGENPFHSGDDEPITHYKTVDGQWNKISGVYTVPDDQTTTRFAFRARGPNNGCGNLLDDIQFKTLLGNVQLEIDPQNSNQVNVSYYWGDTGSATLKYSIVEKNTSNTPVTGDVDTTGNGTERSGTIDLSSLTPGKTYTVSVYHSGYTSNTVDIDVYKPLPTFTVNAAGLATLNDIGAAVEDPNDSTKDLNAEDAGTFSIASYTPAQLAQGFKVTSSDTSGTPTTVTVKVRKVNVTLAVNDASPTVTLDAAAGFETSSLSAAGTVTKYYTWVDGQTVPATAGELTIAPGTDGVITGFNTEYAITTTPTTTYHSVTDGVAKSLSSLTGTDAGIYTINVAIKSRAAMLSDGFISKLGGEASGDTAIGDGNLNTIADGLVELIGTKDDGAAPFTEDEANRAAFMAAFGMDADDMAKYDELTPAGKKEVTRQLVKTLATGDTDTVGELAGAIAIDLGSSSTLEKFAETQLKLETSNPTNGSVSTITPSGTGLAIGINLGKSTDGTAVIPAATGGVTVYSIGAAPEYTKTPVGGSFNKATGEFEATGQFPDGTTALEVEITDANGFTTTTKTVLNKTTISNGYKQGVPEPGETYGGMGGATAVNGTEKTMSASSDSYTKYVPTGVTYESGGVNDNAGKVATEPPITLTIAPISGAYADFYVGTTLITAANAVDQLGASAQLVAGADGAYTLTYKASEAGGKEIKPVYRNLIGEANAATGDAALVSVLGDDNFDKVFNGNADTGAGTDALGYYKGTTGGSTSPEQQADIRGMLLNKISRGGDSAYDVAEFNAALENASRYVKARDAVAAALDGAAGFTAGSVAEAQRVYDAVVAAYATATTGDAKIAPDALEALMKKLEKAQDQLVPSTFSVEITPVLPENVTITITAAQPQVGSPAGAQSVTLANGQTGHVFPQYGTPVTLTLPEKADYEVYVGGELKTTSPITISNVTSDADISVEYRRKDVSFTLPESVTGWQSDVTEVTSEENEDGSITFVQSAGTDLTLFFTPAADTSILPGATVTFDGGTTTYPVTVNPGGGYSVTVPANTLKDKTAEQITASLDDAATDDGDKLTTMIGKAEAIVGDDGGGYSLADDNAYTQESWEALKAALDEAQAVQADGEATDTQKAAAAAALEAAYNALVRQYQVALPVGGRLLVPSDVNGKPTQEGVVYDESAGVFYVAEGVSLVLTVRPMSGQKIDSVTYKMDTNHDGDTDDIGVDQRATAYPVNGIVTIPVIKGVIEIAGLASSDKGFAVENGSMGAATGVLDPAGTGVGDTNNNANDEFTVTPETGSKLTGVTVDGTKVNLPDEEELKAVLAADAVPAHDWHKTDADDLTKGATLTVADVNGRNVEFTMAPLDASGNPITGTTTITATLPGLGRVEVTASGGTVTAKVLAKGNTGLNVGTVIDLTGSVDGSSGAATLSGEAIKVAAPNGTLTGAEIQVLPATGAGGVKIDFGGANSGSHSVAATTTLKSYDMSLLPAAQNAGVLINGKTEDTVKHGSPLIITIPKPADTDKEIGMDTVINGTLNGENVTGLTLSNLTGVEVTINADGSATLSIPKVMGETSIISVSVVEAPKDTAATAAKLAADKAAVAELANELGELLTEARLVETNTGKLYDVTTPEWGALTTAGTGEIDVMTALQTALGGAADDADAVALLATLNTALGVSGDDEYESVAEAIAAIRSAADELDVAITAAKIYAPGVVTVSDDYLSGAGVDAGSSIAVSPDAGMVNPNVSDGADLVISGIKMQDGYLPRVTVHSENDGARIYEVRGDDTNGYTAHEVTVDPDTGVETVEGTAATGVTVSKSPTTGEFSLTFANANLNDTLGFGEPDKTLKPIMGFYVVGVKQGVILPSASALKAGLQTGGTNGADGAVEVTVGGNPATTDDTTPVVPTGATTIITVPLGEDDYYGKALSSADPKATVWHKTLSGVELEGKFYERRGTALVHTDADGVEETLAGVTVEETTDAVSGNPVAKITIDTGAEGFDADKDYTTLQMVLEPTNSQYVTFRREFDALTDAIDAADAAAEEGTEPLGAETLAVAIKRVEKLTAEASGALPAPYKLTTQNKDYLTGEVAQLGAYKDRLTAFYNAARVENDIGTLYNQIVNEMEIPIAPVTNEKKATLAAMEEVIKARQADYDALTPYEKTLVPADTLGELNALTAALQEAQRDGMSDADKFNALVSDIAGAVGASGTGIGTANADLIDSMIRAAEDMYAGMSEADKAASAVTNARLSVLKGQLNTYLTGVAANFATAWLTTDYTAGATINNPGTADYQVDGTNRLDSDKDKPGYADRLLLAKQKYDALSAAEQAAVDKLFKSPTLTEQYKETFPALRGAAIVPDDTVADNFVDKYLSVNGIVIENADAANYSKIIGAKDAYDALTDEQKALVNDRLAPASFDELYDDALMVEAGADTTKKLSEMTDADIDALSGLSDEQKEALKDARDFINDNLKYDGSVVTESNGNTRSTILSAKSAWDGLSELAKAAVNGALTGSYKGQPYESLYSAASSSGGFISGDDGDKTETRAGDPYANGVADLLNVDDHIAYMVGDAGAFRPKDGITRAEAAQLFYNLLKNKDVALTVSFTDVPETKWYAKAVNTLAALGVIEGRGGGVFDPESPMSRAEFVAIAARFAKEAEGEVKFSDVPDSHWAYAYISSAVYYGWIEGYSDGSFRPDNSITRAEAAALVNRMLDRRPDKDAIDKAEGLREFDDLEKGYWAYYEIMEAANAHDHEHDKDGVETWTD